MRKGLFIVLFLLVQVILGQQAIHNFGNLQLHDKGLVGFHTGLVNDGSFDENLGLIGFYHDEESLLISGAFSPSFYDFETAVEGDLHLDVPINIDNSINFIYGNIKSTRYNKNVYVRMSENAFYEGEVDMAKIDGQAAVDGQKVFSFPVGVKNTLRPLAIKFIDGPFLAKCAYFDENPDFPQSFTKGFDTSLRDVSLASIHTDEFWNMTTSGMLQVTLNWDSDAGMISKVGKIEGITVAGWNKKEKQWFNLGAIEHDGTIDRGWVRSETFNANDFEMFTFGFLFHQNSSANNYAMSPNGDGSNEYLTFKVIDKYPSNKLMIFNREGRLVYEKSDYKNEFNGTSNKNSGQRGKVLPEGVYFYVLDIKKHNLKYQGYIYLVL